MSLFFKSCSNYISSMGVCESYQLPFQRTWKVSTLGPAFCKRRTECPISATDFGRRLGSMSSYAGHITQVNKYFNLSIIFVNILVCTNVRKCVRHFLNLGLNSGECVWMTRSRDCSTDTVVSKSAKCPGSGHICQKRHVVARVVITTRRCYLAFKYINRSIIIDLYSSDIRQLAICSHRLLNVPFFNHVSSRFYINIILCTSLS